MCRRANTEWHLCVGSRDDVRRDESNHGGAHESASLRPLDVQRTRDAACFYRRYGFSPCPAGKVVPKQPMSKPTRVHEVTNQAIRSRDENRCGNCGEEGKHATLDVHHIVPRGQGGSNLMSNQTVLCRRCHDAAHGKQMAPTVQSMSTGTMKPKTFELYRQFWSEIFPAVGEICNVPVEPIYINKD